jgi:hypothetical protein
MMSDQRNDRSRTDADQFARQAGGRSGGLMVEFLDFMRLNKKWWLTPILLALLLVTALIVLASTGAAPFIYTLF